MQLSETIKLYPTQAQKILLEKTMLGYIQTVNSLVSAAASGISIKDCTTADVEAGSYLRFEGEDGDIWTWAFSGGKVAYLS